MDSSNKIKVTQEDWKAAKQFFAENPNAIKFRKKSEIKDKDGRPIPHLRSFVRVNGEIYALNNQKHITHSFSLLGKSFLSKEDPELDINAGAFGRVKWGINEKKDKLIALKVSGTPLKQEIKEILQKRGYIIGQEQRVLEKKGKIKVTQGGTVDTDVKVYTAMPYLDSGDMTKVPKKTNEAIVLGLYAMMEIEALHQDRVLHRDIKLDNFMVNKVGNHLVALPVDFDFLTILPPRTRSMTEAGGSGGFFDKLLTRKIIGTPGYMAPEVEESGEYSFGSDIYALGKMLEKMRVPKELYADMINDNRKKEGALRVAIEKVATYLRAQPNDPSIQKVIADYEIFSKKRPEQPEKTEGFSSLVASGTAALLKFGTKKETPANKKVEPKVKNSMTIKALSDLIIELELIKKEARANKTFDPEHPVMIAIDISISLLSDSAKNKSMENIEPIIQQLLKNLSSTSKQSKKEQATILNLKNKIINTVLDALPGFKENEVLPSVGQKPKK